jgi:membrane protein
LLILFILPKFVTYIKGFGEFVTTKIWKIRINKVSKRQGIVIKQLRVIALASKGFYEDNCLVSATALTFYTLFSIVPILSLIFAIAQGFGYEKTLQEDILAKYPEYRDILTNAFVYANSMLSTTKGGVIAGFGIVLLLWSVMKLLISIENSFNYIWEVRRGRSWVRKTTDYLTIMMVGPLLLIVSGGITVALQNEIGNLHLLGVAGTILINLLAYSLVGIAFAFLFYVMPNTGVNIRSAISAAIISTILFELLGWGYIKFQVGANRMNAIYGGFAALPLFLIWVQYSWYIVLYGAELAYAHQYVDHYELEEDIQNLSMRYKKVISLMIANLVAKRFHNGEKALGVTGISEALDFPSRLTKNIVNQFVETGIFVEVRTDVDKELVYQPGVTESKFTVQYIIDTLERKGVNDLPINDSNELKRIHELMHDMDKLLDTQPGHLLVKDIVK